MISFLSDKDVRYFHKKFRKLLSSLRLFSESAWEAPTLHTLFTSGVARSASCFSIMSWRLCVRLPRPRARQKLRPCFYSRALRHQTTRRSPGLRSDRAELGLNSRLWVQPCHAIRLRTACDHHHGARRSGLSCRTPACH